MQEIVFCQMRVTNAGVSCPVGDVLKDGNNFRECRTSSDLGGDKPTPRGSANIPPPPGARKLGDDCPRGSFCLVISSSYAQENGTGYCCPALNDNCPVGSPHPNAQCDSFGPNSISCPWETHYCHSVSFGGSNSKQLCCPKVCSNDAILVDKQCYPKVKVGDKCIKQEQCQSFLASCVNGLCQCDSGAKQAGSAAYPYCTKDCQSDEVLRDKTCVKRLKLSDVCQKEKEYLCPENAYCNKNNQCACRCGYFTLADNTCAPPPVCHPPRPYPMFAVGGRADSMSAAGPPPPPPVVRISDEERDKLLKNVTFCAVRNKAVPNGIKVSQCPSNMYCSNYLTNLGLCCKIPEPQCFGGGKPQNDKQCDAKDPFSCGLDATCLKFVFAVDQEENSKANTICCPKFSFEPDGAAPMALSAGPPPPAGGL
uniref:EB domain-containing protein n=1 Tax=Romanomermis culicivorax TaxID=13658 RepID=A0A915IGY4_ROMCU